MKKQDIEKEIQSRLDEPNDHFEQIWNEGFIYTQQFNKI